MGRLKEIKEIVNKALDMREAARLEVGGATVAGGALLGSDEADASFIGKAARLFPHDRLAMAVKMEDAGVNPDEIWKKTGMGRGADGEWRYEVDDSERSYDPVSAAHPNDVEVAEAQASAAAEKKARFVEENKPFLFDDAIPQEVKDGIKERYKILAQEERSARYNLEEIKTKGSPKLLVGDALRADVITHYPQLAGARFQHIDMPYVTRGGYSPDGGIEINRGFPLDKQESTMLHEVQHGVQDIEGFARGGSPGENLPSAEQLTLKINTDAEVKKRAIQSSDEYNKFVSDWVNQWDESDWPVSRRTGEPDKKMLYPQARLLADQRFGIGEIDDARREAIESVLSDTNMMSDLKNDRYPAYKRLAGEVEARNVQTRMDMQPDERRKTPPWQTEDVPRNQQIVRFGAVNNALLRRVYGTADIGTLTTMGVLTTGGALTPLAMSRLSKEPEITDYNQALSDLRGYERQQKYNKVKQNLQSALSAGASGVKGVTNLGAYLFAGMAEDAMAGLIGMGAGALHNDFEAARQVEVVKDAIPDVPLGEDAQNVVLNALRAYESVPEQVRGPVNAIFGAIGGADDYIAEKVGPKSGALVRGVLEGAL